MVSGSIVDSIPVDLAENKLFLSVEGQKGDLCLSTLWGQKQTFPSWGSRASQPISAAPPSLLRLACLPGLSGTPKRSGQGRVLPEWSCAYRVCCAYSLPMPMLPDSSPSGPWRMKHQSAFSCAALRKTCHFRQMPRFWGIP